MTDKQTAELIADIREVTERICVSRESAGEFLRNAGIFGKDSVKSTANNNKNLNTKKKAE
ncbi:hypothetical protein [Mucilaginibacter flavidus]|uniref:hypothetical protein n=1 Tax=Mucilaginibacter flavidus TaxID=2949309 RepID=UPI00209328DD|nr:hypothetical protein [Mucilaginibacter flavidus]MCO5948937.1 hypothetical protein [Mucilaginibacter flavidus]